jgi:V8-like Glu-specific endopeptidase
MERKNLIAFSMLLWMPMSAFPQPRIVKHTVDQQESLLAADYWTPLRRASAIPREWAASPSTAKTPRPAPSHEPLQTVPGRLPELGETAELPQEPWSPESAEVLSPAPPAVEEAEWARIDPLIQTPYPYPFVRYNVPAKLKNDFPYKAIGKLFFTLSGTNYVCSASVIRPHLLLTARHCIYESGTFATNVVFYPGYAGGPNNALGGAWYANNIITWHFSSSAEEWDIGFIQTKNHNRTGCKATSTNKQVESYTGYMGYAWGGDYSRKHFDLFGFPQGAPFNGKVNVQCEAATGDINVRGINNTIEVGCDATGGTSGGPWIHTFQPGAAGSSNLVRSLNSFRWSDRPSALNGPVFLQHNFYALLIAAQQLPC